MWNWRSNSLSLALSWPVDVNALGDLKEDEPCSLDGTPFTLRRLYSANSLLTEQACVLYRQHYVSFTN